MTELHWTDVDGVTTVWADAPGPLRAGLFFRTGRADETLASSGWTHLIEHLAIAGRVDPARNNGFVDGAMSGFLATGSPEEVRIFFLEVCNALSSIAGERLQLEKQVLEAEGAARRHDVKESLLTARFGAQGYGLIGFRELGLRSATAEQLREFRQERFASGNAIFWITGSPPAGLHLPLPAGHKHPCPPLNPVQSVFPCWCVDDLSGGIAVGSTVARGAASLLFCTIAARRLWNTLRVEKGISYAPSFSYEALDSNTTHLVLYADSDAARRPELADAVGDFVAGLLTFEETELAASVSEIHDHWTGPLAPPPAERVLGELTRAVADWLFGRTFKTMEALQAENTSVTVTDLAAIGRQVQQSMIVALTSGLPIRPWIGKRAGRSAAALPGRGILHLNAPMERTRLVHNPDGVSVVAPDGSHVTVRYADLAAAVSYEDGGICLVGRDAATIAIEPTLWPAGRNLCREIRQQVPSHLLLDQGSRPVGSIPKPSTTAWQRLLNLRDRLPQLPGTVQMALRVLLVLLILRLLEAFGRSLLRFP